MVGFSDYSVVVVRWIHGLRVVQRQCRAVTAAHGRFL